MMNDASTLEIDFFYTRLLASRVSVKRETLGDRFIGDR